MKKLSFLFIAVFILITNAYSQDEFFQPDDLFHIDHMDSHNKEFSLYFKGREKSILARGENDNYINDCLLYTSPSPRDTILSRMPSSA